MWTTDKCGVCGGDSSSCGATAAISPNGVLSLKVVAGANLSDIVNGMLAAIADKKYQDKVERAKPEPENWDDWSGWDQNRFMYLLWARVFPFSPHWLLNLASGLLNNKGVIFSEFFVSTVLGTFDVRSQIRNGFLTYQNAARRKRPQSDVRRDVWGSAKSTLDH